MSDYKEYLVPDNGGYRIAVQDAGLPIAEDWIEIPEGAEILTGLESVKFSQVFWKPSVGEVYQDGAFRSYNFHKSMSYEEYKSNWTGNLVLWQRESDQDEPFLTPECTLNDQCTEIEKVRQHKKHERNSSAWDVQIGGNHYKQFQIQPMQFALENKLDAAQQNVIKYIMRHSFKNGKQDLEKAKHYIDLMIEFYYGENNNG